MNSSLCQNGVVLTGKDLERYSKRKGLCHICARFKTHKRAGKLLRRNKWEPLTIKNDEGNYLVYKGHCIQPTCFTLDQAKESLGEKEKPAPRGSIRGSGQAVGISPWKSQWKANAKPPATPSNATAAQRASISSTGTTTQQRRESYESAARNSPRGSVNSFSGSVTSARFSLSEKWSREMPQITLPSLASSSNHAGSATPTGTGTGSATPTMTSNDGAPPTEEDLAKNLERELAGAISNLTTSLYMKRPSDDSKDSPDAQSTVGGKSIASAASFHTKLTRSSQDKKKEDGSSILKKSLAIFPGLKKGLKSRKNEEQTDDSSISSGSLSQFSVSDQSQLPGAGFVVDVAEGNYRAAFEALDLAEGQTSSVGKSDFKALCLQSKQLDYLDIEMVAVQVDSKNKHWMSQNFVLGDDDDDVSEIAAWDYDHEHKVVQDLSSGVHKVCLSNVMRRGLEELELEADLDDFEALERVAFRRSTNEFLVFRTRVALEAEIQSCRDLITKAEKSDEPTAIQNGIEARSHLNLLLPLRKFYLSRRELEKKISGLSSAIGGLHSNDLDRRYYLATQKEQLLSQIEEEKREQDILQMKARAQEKRLEGESSEVAARGANSDNLSIATGPEPSVTSTSLGMQEKRHSGIYASPSNLGMDETRGEVVANMTVFQSAPLAYVDHSTGTHHVCPLLDFQYEGRALTQSLKDAETVGAKVDVEFDIATTDRLSAFLSKSESRVMHLSCHGHPQYLALENGFGGMQILPVRDLKRFIASGAGTLELVFVSACHSKAAGKAFLDAGIRHVICCRQDDKFRDEGAIEFARTFYRALALNNTLKQAFKMAREAMRISPMVKDSKAEYEKFILLPELPEDDPYHDVYIFSDDDDRSVRRPSIGLRQVPAKKRRARILPRLPQYFVGREMDMYTILDALRSNDIVSVQGPPEVGKTSLVAAISRYIEQRHKSFLFDDVFWLPVQEGSIPPEDKLCQDLSRIFKLIKRASSNTSSFQGLDKLYADCWGRVIRQLHDKRVLMVVHGRVLESPASKERLENFLRDLLKVSNCKIITVDVPVIEEAGPTTAIVDVEALDFDATVLLFARLTRSTSASTQHIVKALTSFQTITSASTKTTEEPSKAKLIAWRRRRTFGRIGSGFPAAIRRAALEMSDEDLTELLRLAKKPLVDVTSREDLEAKLTNLECDEGVELKANNFLKARDIRETIEELRCLRRDFPTLQELRGEEKEVQSSLQMAIATKQYDDASRLKKVLSDLQIQISKELNHKELAVQLERIASF